ncbi:MAG: N-acetylmuramoyl-L-alanine amidase [Deltaproteobacteria bacterium]|nr:N-acetylmuramoyl-L-alanine amidase [Deltaproteobacteria bacterium]
MRRPARALSLVILLGALGAAPAPSDLEQRYQRARAEMQRLLDDPVRSRLREPYEILLKKLDDLVTADPAGPTADRAAFTAATLCEELSKASRVPADLETAQQRWRSFVECYPRSRLADDALMAAAHVALERRSDQIGARELLATLVERYPQGDMAPPARELLGRLPRPDSRATGADQTGGASSRPSAGAASDDNGGDRIGALLKKAEIIGTAAGKQDDAAAAVRAADARLRRMEDEVAAPSTASRLAVKSDPAAAVSPPASLPASPAISALRQATADRPARVKKLRLKTTGTETTVLIEIDAAAELVPGEALPDAKRQLPHRVFYDLSPARLERGARDARAGKGSPVSRVRAAQNTLDTVRVVLELAEGARATDPTPCADGLCVIVYAPGQAPVAASETRPTVSEKNTAESAPSSTPAVATSPTVPPPAAIPSVAAAAAAPVSLPAEIVPEMLPKKSSAAGLSLSQQVGLNVRTIVLDPGHGGSDPGAIGPTGLREKDVTLKLAKRIAEKLRKELGVDVVMTRETDRDLSLEQRAAIANEAHADLFLSIHVNASPNRRAYGIETFYLNTTDDRYAIRLAARENTGSEKSIGDLQFILADLVTKSNVDDSRRLSTAIQSNMVAQVRKRYGSVKDLGVKHALFYVLIGVKMPSILLETSFISNRREEGRLRQNAYLDAIAEGVVRGVRSFIESQKAPGT